MESFERSLAVAQQHLGLEPESQVQVMYKTGADLAHLLPLIANVLIPFLIFAYFFRMMRGGGPLQG